MSVRYYRTLEDLCLEHMATRPVLWLLRNRIQGMYILSKWVHQAGLHKWAGWPSNSHLHEGEAENLGSC